MENIRTFSSGQHFLNNLSRPWIRFLHLPFNYLIYQQTCVRPVHILKISIRGRMICSSRSRQDRYSMPTIFFRKRRGGEKREEKKGRGFASRAASTWLNFPRAPGFLAKRLGKCTISVKTCCILILDWWEVGFCGSKGKPIYHGVMRVSGFEAVWWVD